MKLRHMNEEDKSFGMNALNHFLNDFGGVGNARIIEVDKAFNTTCEYGLYITMPSYILVDDVNGKTWRFGFGSDSTTANYWLVDHDATTHPEQVENFGDEMTWEMWCELTSHNKQTHKFIEFDNLLEFIKTGTCVECVEPTHYVLHGTLHKARDMNGEYLELTMDHNVDNYVLDGDGIQIGDKTFVRTLYKAQMEMIHTKTCHYALNPEYDDVEPRVLPDLEVISYEDYDNLVRENREG